MGNNLDDNADRFAKAIRQAIEEGGIGVDSPALYDADYNYHLQHHAISEQARLKETLAMINAKAHYQTTRHSLILEILKPVTIICAVIAGWLLSGAP